MAAIQASLKGARVTILEKNEKPGKKILASGNGRCNLTNTLQEPEHYRGEDPLFAWQVVGAFGVSETIGFFTRLGIYTKNKDGWIYPYSEQASSVLEVMLLEALHQKVTIKTNEIVTGIVPGDDGFQVQTATWTYKCDRVILAAGSAASGVKGAGMDGYELAEILGHRIVKPLPALVGLRGVGDGFSSWAGVRMDANVSLLVDGVTLLSTRGEVQFTDYGVSGIPVFQLSRFGVRGLEDGHMVAISLDFMPDFHEMELEAFLTTRLEQCPYKRLEELLIGILPKRLIMVICKEVHSISGLATKLKQFEMKIKSAHSMVQAQVCSGGVAVEEIDVTTMESKIVSGVYFAGEVVDVDGACGGYNLQWAWSSGAVAGRCAAIKNK
jgi:predicted Rossmann fold flavoprotein